MADCVCLDRHVDQVCVTSITFRVMFMHNERRAAQLCRFVRVVVSADEQNEAKQMRK